MSQLRAAPPAGVDAQVILLTRVKLLGEMGEVPEPRHALELPLAAPSPIEPPLAALRGATDKHQIAETLLHFAAPSAGRALLFVVQRDELRGYAGRGLPPGLDARALHLSLLLPSCFKEAVDTRQVRRGGWRSDVADRSIFDVLGGVAADALLAPIAIRDRTAALLFADALAQPLPDPVLHATLIEAGLAFERLILEAKRRASAPTCAP